MPRQSYKELGGPQGCTSALPRPDDTTTPNFLGHTLQCFPLIQGACLGVLSPKKPWKVQSLYLGKAVLLLYLAHGPKQSHN